MQVSHTSGSGPVVAASCSVSGLLTRSINGHEVINQAQSIHQVESRAAQLNRELGHCQSWEALSLLFYQHHAVLDFINISTIWTRLATLYDGAGLRRGIGAAGSGSPPPSLPPVQEAAFRQFLAELIAITSVRLHAFGVQALSNVMWAMSNADWHLEQHEPAADELLQQLCGCVCRRVHALHAADVSNICCAVGRLDHRWRRDFVVTFFRSILRRDDLMSSLDVTTLNNLLFGLARARRRGLMRLGPATLSRLTACVANLLSNPDHAATRLEPWRAAQLLYNCHKLRLRIRWHTYTVLMGQVEQLHQQVPSPLDQWSFSFVVGYVDAFRRVSPRVRPSLQPLYSYVEGRLGEGTTSQLAMLSHVFSEMGYPPEPLLWRHVFVRYTGPAYVHVLSGSLADVPSTLRRAESGGAGAGRGAVGAGQGAGAGAGAGQCAGDAGAEVQQRGLGQGQGQAGQRCGQQQGAAEAGSRGCEGQRAGGSSSAGWGEAAAAAADAPGRSRHAELLPRPTDAACSPLWQSPGPGPGPGLGFLSGSLSDSDSIDDLFAMAAPDALPRPSGDDAGEPRTLHYVCWQAAKAGVLPPRAFLRLYLKRMPAWVEQGASDTQLAQVVETIRLLPWLPRGELRGALSAALKARARESRLPLRGMARWLDEQR